MRKLLLIFLTLAILPISLGYKIGDINHDDSIDISDVVYLFKHRNVPLEEGDINCDNSVDIADVVYLFRNYDKFREPVVFAKNFQLEPHWDEGYCIAIDSKGNKFVLLKEGAKNPNIPDAKTLTVPVQRMVAVHICPIGSTAIILNDSICYETIKGVTSYVLRYSPEFQKMCEEGKCVNVGSASNIDYDKVVNISPQIVFLAEWSSHDAMEAKLKELGITVARCFAYKEPTYMGRVEWIKFAATFWGDKEYNKAENYFQKVWKKRNELLRTTIKAKYYPKVINFWKSNDDSLPYIPKAQSYYAKIINNFRGEYVFNDVPGTGNQKIDSETLMERAVNADVVILRQRDYNIKTKEDLLKAYPTSGFENFKAFKNGRFYVSKPDYYRGELIDPIGTMEDYAKMIHPELFPNGDNDLKYFVKLQ